MADGFKTIEKRYGISVESEGHWYNPLTGKTVETFAIYTADGCMWENGLSRRGVKEECMRYGDSMIAIMLREQFPEW